MRQSKRHSLLETCVSVGIGFGAALALQVFLAWKDHMPFTFVKNLEWTFYFTLLSIVRGYYVRRLFNWWHHRG